MSGNEEHLLRELCEEVLILRKQIRELKKLLEEEQRKKTEVIYLDNRDVGGLLSGHWSRRLR